MIFNTWTYAVFITVVFIIYWLIPRKNWRLIFLFAICIVFYTYSFPLYTILIMLLSSFVYTFGALIRKFRETKNVQTGNIEASNINDGSSDAGKKIIINPTTLLLLSVFVCVLALGYYKYWKLAVATYNGTMTSLGQFLAPLAARQPAHLPVILVPLGLSFFIFEFIHYLVDCYYGRVKKETALEFGIFAMFFPTLVSGPIKRFQPFLEQLRNLRSFDIRLVSDGVYRIILGLAKKVLIADVVTQYTLPLTQFSKNPDVSPWTLWFAIYAYAFKIYFDFSGYSDIAIGSAKLLGFDIPENFKNPYVKPNISEFWRHWHISLSSWLREYIFTPAVKSLIKRFGRNKPLLLATISQMVTMAVAGIWHGASWNFLVWGLYHGMGLSVHKIFTDTRVKLQSSKRNPAADGNNTAGGNAGINTSTVNTATSLGSPPTGKMLTTGLSTLFTFHFVCIGWVFFVLNIRDSFAVLYRVLFIKNIMEAILR